MIFTKMESYGNDYIYINCYNIKENISIIESVDLKELSKFLSKRHYGIGSDGVVLICKSEVADFKMRIFNPDGTEAEMCGNALRSVGKYVYEYNLTNEEKFSIETLGGIKRIELEVSDNKVLNISAHIGSPIFDPSKIPVDTKKEKFIMENIEVLDKTFKISALSWGNPHAVIFVENLKDLEIEKYGKAIENLDIFPKKTNVTFASIIDRSNINIREWERGTGETLACATGASSAHVIANLLGLVNDTSIVHQLGGDIKIEYKDNKLKMTGNSKIVFDGEIDIKNIKGDNL